MMYYHSKDQIDLILISMSSMAKAIADDQLATNGVDTNIISNTLGDSGTFGKDMVDLYLSSHAVTMEGRCGPMYCGKSTWLNNELTWFADQGFDVIKVTWHQDDRTDVAASDDAGSTHNSSYTKLSSKVSRLKLKKLADLFDANICDISNKHVVGVDEAQFFPDLYDIALRLNSMGKHFRFVGLDGDFRKNKFGQVLDLVPHCDSFKKMKATCKLCLAQLAKIGFKGNPANISGAFTKRLIDSNEQTLIGGADFYVPTCRHHHTS